MEALLMAMPVPRFGCDRRKARRYLRRGIIGRDLATMRYISRKRSATTTCLDVGSYRTIRILAWSSLDVEMG